MSYKYVPSGVFLVCDKGAGLGTLTATNHAGVLTNEEPLATDADLVPLLNVSPCGACSVLYGPCLPQPVQWHDVKVDTVVGPAEWHPLLDCSTLQCAVGGTVRILFTRAAAEAAGAANQLHAAAHVAKEASLWAFAAGALCAVAGVACCLTGVGAVAAPFLFAASAELFEVSAVTFEAGIALDVAALAVEPTLPNLGLVVVDALTLGAGKLIGKAVGKLTQGASEAVAKRLAQQEAERLAQLEAQAVAEQEAKALAKRGASYVSAATKPRGMPLSMAEVEAQFGKHGVDLVNETQAEALRVGSTQAAKPRGPVLSGVKDPLTGETHFGQNAGKIPDDLHPLLKGRVTAYDAQLKAGQVNATESDLLRAGEPGTHSEIVALDKAIKAREAVIGRPMQDSELNEFLLHNRSLVPKSLGEGVPPRCANCWYITDGVRVIGND